MILQYIENIFTNFFNKFSNKTQQFIYIPLYHQSPKLQEIIVVDSDNIAEFYQFRI
jgi:hypothetical protein